MAVVDGTLFVSWYEGSPSRIRAKKYVDNAWVSVDGNGTGGLNKDSTKAAMNTNLASVSENSVTKLYVVFQETNGTANQLRVKLMGPDNTAPTASAVSFGGTLKVGNTLTGTYTYADAESDAEGATSFKWYTATDAAGTGKTAISGATTSTLALTSAHAGKYIIFEVTPVAAAGTATGTPVSYTSAAAVLDNAAPTASAVSFGGTLKVGNTLTGAYTYADAESDAEGATAFKWYTANDAAGTSKTAISGATTSTLALTSAQVGKYIIFEVTPVAAAGTATGTPVSYTSAAAVLDNAAPTASAVSFSGTLKVGNTLTGAYTYADAEQDAEGATAFKWYTANDAAGTGKTAISGATASTLALTSAQAGKYIIFEVTPVAAAGTATGTPVSYTSAAAVLDNAAPTASAVSFGGTLKVGNTLTGAYTYADAESDAEGATAFKWYTANDAAGTGKTAISGATASTLALTNAQVGKYIIFEVTPVAAAGTTTGTPVSYTSAAAVLDNAAPTASAVSFGGTLKVGNTLTGTYTYADAESDAEGVTAFKWYTANDAAGTDKTAIAGATTSTLALTSAHAGKYIIFEVTPVAAAGTAMGTSVSYTSAAAVLDNAAPTASAVSFGGTLKVGNTLTGAYTYADAEQDAEGATTFKWYTATDAAGTGKTAISGATASTLALTSEQVGKYIIFEVTPVAAAGTTTGTPVSYTSASAVAANAAPVVSNVHITGGIKLGQVLTGSYSYADVEGDAEGLPVFKWYAADDAGGSNKTVIAGASGIKLELKAAQYGKYVSFEVTPTASAGTTPGTPVESEALGPVGVLKGDANGDGIISPADALLVTKYVSGKLTLTDEQKLMLDMDDNGKIDANDAKLILNIYNGKGA
ncbi:dockerin type I domain-containing protein [Cohnella rhizosphaerae]|uniref:Dockerin type I domain-containing protein n=1 Tax=Cohnella rhizosphaerae TaxID=1457232 RepID=A0A9X4QWV1_9BACL|nr:dockerin type I domain-containing protein [Cohnella rhizosphaerae]MDG0814049.1 dockerin type I domain-containing protein [Cohnella rhizosphaerae]